jgi:hypothetical protein
MNLRSVNYKKERHGSDIEENARGANRRGEEPFRLAEREIPEPEAGSVRV